MKIILITSAVAMASAGIYGAIDMGIDLGKGTMISYQRLNPAMRPDHRDIRFPEPIVRVRTTKKDNPLIVSNVKNIKQTNIVPVKKAPTAIGTKAFSEPVPVMLDEVVIADSLPRLKPIAPVIITEINWANVSGWYSRGSMNIAPELPVIDLTVKEPKKKKRKNAQKENTPETLTSETN